MEFPVTFLFYINDGSGFSRFEIACFRIHKMFDVGYMIRNLVLQV